MVYLEDSSSGEFSAAEADSHLHHNYSDHQQPKMRSQNNYPAVAATRPGFPQVTNATTAASSRSSFGDDDSYDEIYSSSDEGSYFSEGDELADYWDPYCKWTVHFYTVWCRRINSCDQINNLKLNFCAI